MDFGNMMTALSLVGAMLFLLMIGMPIAYALLVTGVSGLFFTQPWVSFEYLLSIFPYSSSAKLTYIVLPLFLLMGHLCFSAGIARRAFNSARVWVGSIPGGLAIASVFASAGFGAVSGSSLATSITMGRISVPTMLEEGYSQAIATGTIASAGTLAALIPPSGLLIIYGVVTDTSIVDLFIAGIIPGVLTAILYALLIYFWVKIRPQDAPSKSSLRRYTYREKARATLDSWEILILFIIVMGTIYSGIGTATEAAAFGAGAALLMVVFRSKDRWKVIINGLVESGTTTSAIFFLILGAGLFGIALGTTQFPQAVSNWLVSLDVSIWQKILILLIPFLVLGFFIDAITMILLIMPIIQPALSDAHISSILFGILVVKCAEIGAVTPPVGLNIYVVKDVAPGLRLSEIFKGASFFISADLAIIALLLTFNDVALFLIG